MPDINIANSVTPADLQLVSSNPAAMETLRQYGITADMLSPYINSGTSAIQGMAAFGGLSDMTPQIEAVKGSDYYKSALAQGEDEILQKMSSSGQLRSGMSADTLSKFSPSLLSSLLNDKYGQLGQLFNLGQKSAAALGQTGTNAGNTIAQTLASQANTGAAGTIQSGQSTSNTINALSGLGGSLVGSFK
jgi:hypothetical protein